MASQLVKLQEQLEAVRKEAYDEGFAAGFESAIDVLRKHQTTTTRSESAATGNVSRRIIKMPSGITQSGLPRGVTEQKVEEILRNAAPEAMTPMQITRRAHEREQIPLRETSVGRALRRLVERGEAEQVGNTKTWRIRQQGERGSSKN